MNLWQLYFKAAHCQGGTVWQALKSMSIERDTITGFGFVIFVKRNSGEKVPMISWDTHQEMTDFLERKAKDLENDRVMAFYLLQRALGNPSQYVG